ncbi:hypothetical protein M8998_11930 [Sphingobacterium sp. lm-10]|uniref:hypothetical protein n=1 Tax=Sphingobacterium sp. lm-10 TaxID=2944904 RepID=UPI002022986E|nr:hypothetical protein [Sphingobacterium sp. lm-10]MCL7988647.1 hypothetical protein [Sphingobacterium sp. lm-10]
MVAYKAIVKNLAANSFGMATNFVAQIAMVPLFITYWGVGKYADWILITALSTFFAMTDMGLNRASNNEFVIQYQRHEYQRCEKLQLNAFLFILLVFLSFTSLSAFVSTQWGLKGMLGVSSFTEIEVSATFILLLSQVFITMYGRVYHGVFRATAKTHIAIVVDNVIRILELIVLFLSVFFGLDIITLSSLYIIPSIGGCIFKHVYTRSIFSVKLSFGNFDRDIFVTMIRPSLAFMAFPLGQAIQNQGLVFVVNTFLGGAILVAFTTTRTLLNFLRQIMNMLSTSVNPEVCAAYGRKDIKAIFDIYYRSLIVTGVTTLVCMLMLLLVGKFIFLEWTKHAVPFDHAFFTGMLFVMFVSCIWGLASVIPLSTNTHTKFTLTFLLFQFLGVGVCYAVLSVLPTLSYIPLVLIITETGLLICVLMQNNKFLNTDFKEMIRSLWSQSKFLWNKGARMIRINH